MSYSSQAAERTGLEIAVIGMAGRFPGAKDTAEFWENLAAGRESISTFTDEELLAAGLPPEVVSHPDYVKARGSLADADHFDAPFFGFSRREAEITDPQHRLFLECAWEALESGGYDPRRYGGSIGVYAGSSASGYAGRVWSNRELREMVGGYQIALANEKDYIATRVAYRLDLHGPCLTVQTACSTSLVAVHLACRSLLGGECAMALAGGVSAGMGERVGYMYQKGGISSPDGHCRAFDADAAGTVGGSGVGVVLLKRLDDALRDGDHVHAIIRGSAINNDGARKVGFTAPSVEGQAAAIDEALTIAEVAPETITYVEAHGTGTPLGDPIEIAGLTQAFRRHTDREGYCAIGSLKASIGHLDAAAGVAGLIKTILALRHRTLPASLNFRAPNPTIDFARSPFFVNTETRPWHDGRHPRRAGVSSFGMGGTNAHVVLEEAPPAEASGPSRPLQLLVLSARTEAALGAAREKLARHLETEPGVPLADVAYTLQVGRAGFAHRLALVCRDAAGAVAALRGEGAKTWTGTAEGVRSVAFLFPGQGTQHVGMGAELYRTEPTFRAEVDRCAAILRPHLGADLRDLLYPTDGDTAAAAERLRRTEVAQPAIFVVSYALAKLWMEWGIRPEAMIGHSIGEYVAATLAGVFTLEDALRLVAARGRLMQALPAGAMLSVLRPEAEVRALMGEGLSLAAVNAPDACVVSGPAERVDELQRRLEALDIACQRLHTSHAFHSAMMDPVLEEFREEVRRARPQAPTLPYLSNVSGTWIRPEEATDPAYYATHLRQGVRFADGLAELLRERDPVLLEVGPGQSLTRLVPRQGEHTRGRPTVPSMRHPGDEGSDLHFLLESLGRVWAAGAPVDWAGFTAREQRHRVPLPTYPFERKRYAVELPRAQSGAAARPVSAGKNPDVGAWFSVPSWKRTPVPRPAPSAGPRSWLVLADPWEVGSEVAARLAAGGDRVVTVARGDGYVRGEGAYIVNPRERADFDALLRDLRAAGGVPDRIVHLWSVVTHGDGAPPAERFEEAQHRGVYPLLFLVQALGKHHADPVQLWVVSGGVHEVTGAEVLRPEDAPLLGTARVIPQEYANVRCRSVDVEVPAHRAAERVARALAAELRAESGDAVVALRAGHRWVQGFEPVRLEGGDGASARLREGGVYLITGGLGKIGLLLAEHLAEAARARLVLVGRTPLPPRERWDEWLAEHPGQDRTSARIRRVRSLEEKGAEVLVVAADVADAAQMRRAVEQARARWGALHGVVHAPMASPTDGNVFTGIRDTGYSEVWAQFRPKVYGLHVLEEVLGDEPLDFCILFSSLSTILGGLRFAGYAAANLYMDARVHQRNREGGTVWTSVDWDGWLDGEAAEPAGEGAPAGVGLTPREGIEAFRRILAMDPVSQVVVSTGDLQARIDRSIPTAPAAEPAVSGDDPAPARSSRDVSTPYVAPGNEIEEVVAGVWQEMLGVEQVGVDDDFLELGGHSLLGIQILSRLRREFQVDLSVDAIFRAPTVAGLSGIIEDALLSEIEEMSEEEAARLL